MVLCLCGNCSCWQGLDPGLVNGVTVSEGLEVFWVGYDSRSSVRNDGDVSVLKLPWEAVSVTAVSVGKKWMLLLGLLSLC